MFKVTQSPSARLCLLVPRDKLGKEMKGEMTEGVVKIEALRDIPVEKMKDE